MDRVLNKLHEIEISITKLTEQQVHNHRTFRDFEIRSDLRNDRVEEALFGNGKPGLITDASNLKNSVATAFQEIKDHTVGDRWGFGIVITLLVTVLGWTVFKK